MNFIVAVLVGENPLITKTAIVYLIKRLSYLKHKICCKTKCLCKLTNRDKTRFLEFFIDFFCNVIQIVSKNKISG
jgi:hypothetical protein